MWYQYLRLNFSNLPLTQGEYDSLLLKLGNLEHLHMCICYDEDDLECTPTLKTYINQLISVVPRLERLVFSQWYRNPRDIGESYFLEFSRNIRFT